MPSNIVDIHVENTDGNAMALQREILDGLSKPMGQRSLPTMLLYDERGLRLYDDITTKAPEYYLFGAEEEILKKHAGEIVRVMHQGGFPREEVVLELGSGALRKTSHLLRALSRLVPERQTYPRITYYALDLEKRELERTLTQIMSSDLGKELEGKVHTSGMWGTYEDGLKYVKSGGLISEDRDRVYRSRTTSRSILDPRNGSPASASESSSSRSIHSVDSPPSTQDGSSPPIHIMFLGSSLGNFSRPEQAEFLRSLPLQPGSGDTLLLGLDHANDKGMVEVAYNDPKGYTRSFIMNGLRGAGKVMGDEYMFDDDKWEYVNEYDEKTRRNIAYYKSKGTQVIHSGEQKFEFLDNELVQIEQSVKFSEKDAFTLFSECNLRPIQRWVDLQDRYSLWLLERPPFTFPVLSSRGQLIPTRKYSTSDFGVPSPQEWEDLWTAWDFVTLRMIPPSMLFQKPIDLRHICLFYLGHIPTFLDIHLSRLLQEPHTEPEYFKEIFERGIDPIVDDPTMCHPHSEVPKNDEDWPVLSEILAFQSRVRARLLSLYENLDSGKVELTRKVGRVLFLTFEHEALHLETLLYMLIQRSGSGTISPPGFSEPDWESLAETWDKAALPESSSVTLGPETITIGHDDNEVDDASSADVRNHEYGWDNEHPKRAVDVGKFRIEWRPVTNGEFYEFYKNNKHQVSLPASWVERDGAYSVCTLYGPVPIKIAWHWPVITAYNDLSKYATVKGGRLPTEPELRLFYDKFESGYEGGSNVGFRNWHPIPATTGGKRNGGKGGNGGVWEWTSTTFDKYPGFEASALYPGYSMDFFDEAHQVVLGGSYATIPRIAQRRSMRNWYQRNYPFAWVGGRIVYDN